MCTPRTRLCAIIPELLRGLLLLLLQKLAGADTAGLCFCRLQQHYCAAEYKDGGLGGGKG